MLVKFISFFSYLKVYYHFFIEIHEHYTSLIVYPKKSALSVLCVPFQEYKGGFWEISVLCILLQVAISLRWY